MDSDMVRQLLELTAPWELRFVVFTPKTWLFAILDNVIVANYGLRIAAINSESFRRVSRLGSLDPVARSPKQEFTGKTETLNHFFRDFSKETRQFRFLGNSLKARREEPESYNTTSGTQILAQTLGDSLVELTASSRSGPPDLGWHRSDKCPLWPTRGHRGTR